MSPQRSAIASSGRFNPLPTNKAGRIVGAEIAADRPFVSIHSRLIKPGESWQHGMQQHHEQRFNPLPTNKAGRISLCFRRRRWIRRFNPLPTNKAGRIHATAGGQHAKQGFNPLPTNKAGRMCKTVLAHNYGAVSIHSRLIKPGELFLIMITILSILVSIHSRLIKPGECRARKRL